MRLSRPCPRRGPVWMCSVPPLLALAMTARAECIPPSPAPACRAAPAAIEHDLAQGTVAASARTAERRRLQRVLQYERARHRQALAALRAELTSLRRTTAEQRQEIRELQRQIEALKAIEQQMNRREQTEGAAP